MNIYGIIITELIGTFMFLSVILKTGNALAIGIALSASIYMSTGASGGHFNPAVSVMMYANQKIGINILLCYIASQILGGLLALKYHNTFN